MKKLTTALALLAAATTPELVLAGDGVPGPRPRLNDTALTLCLNDRNEPVTDCGGSGQDAEFGRDVNRNRDSNGYAGFHFQKVCNNGVWAGSPGCRRDAPLGGAPEQWACNLDFVTGLMWEVKTTGGGLRDSWRTYTNLANGLPGDTSAYVSAVNESMLCGAKDWRLPTLIELQGLAKLGPTDDWPMVDQVWFPNMRYSYWSSVPYAGNQAMAWAAEFQLSNNGFDFKTDQKSAMVVRSVVASHVGKPRFVVQGDEVRDRQTGLIWQRCAVGQTFEQDRCMGSYGRFTWREAISKAQDIAQQSGVAWRLPNVKEIASLIAFDRVEPAIDLAVFPDSPNDLYWTSTFDIGNTSAAWYLAISTGYTNVRGTGWDQAIRLVRNAP